MSSRLTQTSRRSTASPWIAGKSGAMRHWMLRKPASSCRSTTTSRNIASRSTRSMFRPSFPMRENDSKPSIRFCIRPAACVMRSQ
ncbi:hypothetical protein D9M69_645410 [compost metagenome]